ncbi:MAG: hypothetical protein ACXVS6_22770 [Solirubrobacteraceae bacterium]
MSAGDVRTQPSLLDNLARELERTGAGRPAEIAPRIGPDRSEDDVWVGLAARISDGVAGLDHEIAVWWVP